MGHVDASTRGRRYVLVIPWEVWQCDMRQDLFPMCTRSMTEWSFLNSGGAEWYCSRSGVRPRRRGAGNENRNNPLSIQR